MRAALVLVTFGACWTTASPPPPVMPTPRPTPIVEAHRIAPRVSPCEQAVDHLAEIERDELSKIPDFADKLEALRDVTVASCEEAHWSAELMACFHDTADTTALQQCQSLFTSDQTSDLMRRITEILTGLNGPP
jgi:hypothetical protein